MTNSRLTDAEIMETRLPLRVHETSIAKTEPTGECASQNRGGAGMVREIEVLEDSQVSFIGSSRQHAPRPVGNAHHGAPGTQQKIDAAGNYEELPACFEAELRAGERVRITTPGGSGFQLVVSTEEEPQQ